MWRAQLLFCSRKKKGNVACLTFVGGWIRTVWTTPKVVMYAPPPHGTVQPLLVDVYKMYLIFTTIAASLSSFSFSFPTLQASRSIHAAVPVQMKVLAALYEDPQQGYPPQYGKWFNQSSYWCWRTGKAAKAMRLTR